MANFDMTLKSASSDTRMTCEDLIATFNTMIQGTTQAVRMDCEQEALHMVRYKIPEYYQGT